MGGTFNFIVNDDPEAARPRIAPHLAYQWKSYAYYGNLGTETDAGSAVTIDPETLRTSESVALSPLADVVTPAEAVRRVREWIGEMPIEHAYFWASIAGMPEDLVDTHIELLGRKVAPALRAEVGADV